MRLNKCDRGLEPSVSSTDGKQLTLNSMIKHLWENYYYCFIDYEPGRLKIVADNKGDYLLSRQKSCIKVTTYRVRDRIPHGKLKCELNDNILTVFI